MTSANTPGELRIDPRLNQSGGEDPGLLCQLAPCSQLRFFGRLQFSGGQLPDPAVGNIAVLTQQAYLLQVVERDDGCAAGMVDHLELRVSTVGQDDLVHRNADDATLVVQGAVESAHCS